MRPLAALLVASLAVVTANACKKEVDDATADDTPSKKKNKSTPPKTAKVPEKHRDKHESCSKADTPPATKSTFGPRMMTPPGPPCTTKADCKDEANGRCSSGHCTYDGCYEDSDCKPSGVCTCSEEGKRGYFCKVGDCSVDSDCGAQGYCSPTWDTQCGAFFGVTGFYCHVADDECTDDGDCKKDKEQGYCAYSKEKKHWICGYGHCVG